MVTVALVAFFVVAWVLAGRVQRREQEKHDAAQRRIGWGYGYGAGWVDSQSEIYLPVAPKDGRTRTEQESAW